MINEKMTVHKALAELKTLSSRINDAIGEASFVTTNKHGNTRLNGKPISDFNNSALDAMKSITALINRRNAIKRAVTNSNAVTKVTIGDTEYTVAEAIDMKANGMAFKQALMNRISAQLEAARRTVDRENGQKLDDRADQYIRNLYENAEMKNLSDEVKKVRNEFVDSQTVDIIDPIHAENELKKLRDEIDSFMTEVDSALSVSNALTTIEIEYETY